MGRAAIEISGETASLAAVGAIAARLEHREPLWRAIGEEIAQQTAERFETSTGPDGQVWPPSWRVKTGQGGGPTLVDRGILKTSMTLNVHEDGGEFGSPMEYAAIHQFGGEIKAKTQKGLRWKYGKAGANKPSWATKQSVTIPARPYLGINEENEASLMAVAENYLLLGELQ